MVGGGGQPFVEIVLLVHEQELQDQRGRHHARDQFLRAAEAGVEKPDEPDDLDQREDKRQIFEGGIFLQRRVRHGLPPSQRRMRAVRRMTCARHGAWGLETPGGGNRRRMRGSPPRNRSGHQLALPAIFHLSFQALCSLRNLARPGCTGICGLASMPCTCMPTKSFAIGVKPGSIFTSSSRLS